MARSGQKSGQVAAAKKGAGTEKQDLQQQKAEKDSLLTEELELSFPASDPPSSVQPGAGITGPEVVEKKK